jgi:N-acetylglutamate synthase-like GNAT family acetyltransferase
MYEVKEAVRLTEIASILQFRYKMLREPWNQPFDSTTDGNEADAINAYLEDASGTIIACGRLHENPGKKGQIRFMAVATEYQGKGLGKIILKFLEDKAKENGLKKIELQARENAVEFYKSQGYTQKEKTFMLWDLIQHYLMEKQLS